MFWPSWAIINNFKVITSRSVKTLSTAYINKSLLHVEI